MPKKKPVAKPSPTSARTKLELRQERGRRGSTENVPAIVGLGEAARLAREVIFDEAARVAALRDRLVAGPAALDDARVNGHPQYHLPGIASVSFAGADSESLLLALDLEGIAASSGSACTSGSLEPSHVIAALGVPARFATGTLRFSRGRWTADDEVDQVLDVLPRILRSVRRVPASGAWGAVSSLPVNSSTIRWAVFLPMPGMELMRATSAAATVVRHCPFRSPRWYGREYLRADEAPAFIRVW